MEKIWKYLAAAGLMTVLVLTACYIPVSYTHLDVYKRQGHGHGTARFGSYAGALQYSCKN